MADRTPESVRAAHLESVRAQRVLVVQALRALAGALVVAAVVIFVLMLVVWYRSCPGDASLRDFPGRYWFAVLPTLAAAVTLAVTADRIETPPEHQQH